MRNGYVLQHVRSTRSQRRALMSRRCELRVESTGNATMLMHHAQTNSAPVDTAGAAASGGRDLALERCQWRGALFRSACAWRRTDRYSSGAAIWPGSATAEPSRGDSSAARGRSAEVSALYALCRNQPQRARELSRAYIIISDDRGGAGHTTRSPGTYALEWIAVYGVAGTSWHAHYSRTITWHLYAANAYLGRQRTAAVFWSGCDLLRAPAHHTFTRAPRTAAPLTPPSRGRRI
jgi:hypothetical protein